MDRRTLIAVAKFVWIIYFFYVVYVNQPQKPGNMCIMETGNAGRCVGIKECPDAMELLKVGIPRRVCSYENGYPVVCCRKSPKVKNLINCKNAQTPKPKYDSVTKIRSRKPCVAEEFPHVVALGFDNGGDIVWGCEGKLISKRFVSTEVNCLSSPTFGPVKYVRLGDLNDDKIKPQYFTVLRTNKHPSKYHDIALLELDAEANMTDYVKYVCRKVDNLSENYADSETEHFDLQEIKNRECNPYYPMNERLLHKAIQETYHVCAGNPEKDTCKADSAGPLQTYRDQYKNNFYFTEVTSFSGEFIKWNLEKVRVLFNQWWYNNASDTAIPDADPYQELWGGPELRGPQL